LTNKGILTNRGSSFIKAGEKYGVNEIYLISHALLETGHGQSALAQGVEVGLNSSNKATLVTASNRSSLKNIKRVYNMYGIGAFDNVALSAGATYAYNNGWFSPEIAIIEGARFVSNNYFSRGQDTLYKMRWNPENPGVHQYATDIGWAAKQIYRMRELYSLLDNPTLKYDIPKYK
jgi:beta-N-acetylglucosaminidase